MNLLSAVIMLSRVDGASDFHDKSEVIVLYHALNNQAFARLVLIAGSFYLSFYKNKFVNIIVGFIFSIICTLAYFDLSCHFPIVLPYRYFLSINS